MPTELDVFIQTDQWHGHGSCGYSFGHDQLEDTKRQEDSDTWNTITIQSSVRIINTHAIKLGYLSLWCSRTFCRYREIRPTNRTRHTPMARKYNNKSMEEFWNVPRSQLSQRKSKEAHYRALSSRDTAAGGIGMFIEAILTQNESCKQRSSWTHRDQSSPPRPVARWRSAERETRSWRKVWSDWCRSRECDVECEPWTWCQCTAPDNTRTTQPTAWRELLQSQSTQKLVASTPIVLVKCLWVFTILPM